MNCYCGSSGYLSHRTDNRDCPRNRASNDDEPMFSADLKARGDLAEAYGRLKGTITAAIGWLENNPVLMSRAEVANFMRKSLERAESVRNNNGGTE